MSGGIKKQYILRGKLKKMAADKEAYFENAISSFKKAIRPGCLAITGGLRSIENTERILEQQVDLTSIYRPLICKPDFVNRILYSSDKYSSKCISYNRCLWRGMWKPLNCVEFDSFQTIVKTLD